MRKRILAVLLCVITCLSMTSCALFGGKHDSHKFRARWESNAGFHWHECKFADCKEKSSYELHTYENGKCTKCKYKQQTLSEHK